VPIPEFADDLLHIFIQMGFIHNCLNRFPSSNNSQLPSEHNKKQNPTQTCFYSHPEQTLPTGIDT
jgi:hypothetical protein